MKRNAKVFGRLKFILGIIIFALPFIGLGCKGSSDSNIDVIGGGTAHSAGSTSPPLLAQSTLDCGPSLTTTEPGVITGIIRYVDKEFDRSGFTGLTPCKAVKFSDVQIVRASDSAVLAAGSTNSLGFYAISGTGFLGETVYVRALTSSVTSNKQISVKSGPANAFYSVISNDFSFTAEGAIKELSVSISSTVAEPFNVFSVLMAGAIFAEAITDDVLPKATIGFYPNNLDDGTYFSTPNLHICGGCGNDDDGWDDTVIMHEFGHFIANAYSLDHSPGGAHSLTGHFELPLTWSEGWATFFSSALRDFLGIAEPEYYVDTNGINGQSIGISYEIETPASPSKTTGADNEVAVSAVLWDIYDTVDEAVFDSVSSGIGTTTTGIWDVFQNYLPNTNLVSLEDFWDGWFNRGNGALNGTNDITSIFEDRSIFYREDSAEPDDSSGSATTLQVNSPVNPDRRPQNNRTFYPFGDEDWYQFRYTHGNVYTVETLDLGDGADPVIGLYTNPSQPAVCSNDDISTSNVNARLTIPDLNCLLSESGTLYLKVFSSKDPTNPAEFGNYNIRVTL